MNLLIIQLIVLLISVDISQQFSQHSRLQTLQRQLSDEEQQTLNENKLSMLPIYIKFSFVSVRVDRVADVPQEFASLSLNVQDR